MTPVPHTNYNYVLQLKLLVFQYVVNTYGLTSLQAFMYIGLTKRIVSKVSMQF